MGEKRTYKSRKPGGGRKKLKPEYDAGKNLKEQIESAVALYEEKCSLRSIADALNLNPIKVRKLLITAGVYELEVAEKVQDTFEEHREIQSYKEAILSTVATLDLSKASVTSYLPYQNGKCKSGSLSSNGRGNQAREERPFDSFFAQKELSTWAGGEL